MTFRISRMMVKDFALRLPAILSWLTSAYFQYQYSSLFEGHIQHDSRVPIPAAGRIYLLQNHTEIVYVTRAEQDAMSYFTHRAVAFLFLFLVFVLAYLIWKRKNTAKSSSDPAT